jgi:DNA-binding MarR family transcriptional regulator
MSRRQPSPDEHAADRALEFIRVIWAVDHALQSISKRMVQRLGLTAPQRLAVRFIGLYDGVTLGALARLLHLHPGTVTGIVDRLVELRLVTRTRSDEDTRRVHLALTAGGRALDRQRSGTVEAAVRRALRGVPEREVEQAAALMLNIAEALAAE